VGLSRADASKVWRNQNTLCIGRKRRLCSVLQPCKRQPQCLRCEQRAHRYLFDSHYPSQIHCQSICIRVEQTRRTQIWPLIHARQPVRTVFTLWSLISLTLSNASPDSETEPVPHIPESLLQESRLLYGYLLDEEGLAAMHSNPKYSYARWLSVGHLDVHDASFPPRLYYGAEAAIRGILCQI